MTQSELPASGAAGAARPPTLALLPAIISQAPIAIAVLTGADHVVTFANALAVQRWGRPDVAAAPATLIGMRAAEALPQLVAHGLEELIAAVTASGARESRHGLVGDALRDDHGEVVGVVIAGPEPILQAIPSHVPASGPHSNPALVPPPPDIAPAAFLGGWELDVVAQRVTAAPAVLALLGLDGPGPHPLERYVGCILAEDRERVTAEVTRVLAADAHAVLEVEYRARRVDGAVRWVEGRGQVTRDAAGAPLRIAGTVADITARKEAQLERERLLAEVAAARIRLHEQFMQAPVAISIVRGPDFVFELANPLFLELTSRRDVIGRSVAQVFPELPRDSSVLAMLRKVYTTGETFTADEFRIPIARDGRSPEINFVKFSCQPVRDAEGRIAELMTVAVNVTEQVAARHRSDELSVALRRADQRKDEFLAMLAHELRNPLAAVTMALSLLEQDPAPAAANKYRATAQRQVNHLVRMVDDLLDVARITRGRIELRRDRIDLGEVVAQAAAAGRVQVEARGHTFTVRIGAGSFPILADATRIEQVVSNLVSNAAKYTEPGGAVTVELDRYADSSTAVLRVRDTGRGIPREALPHVFDLFVQVAPSLDRKAGGLGLGLTLVKQLIAMHDGRVEVRSEGDGKGSEFIVTLPLAPVAEVPAVASSSKTTSPQDALRTPPAPGEAADPDTAASRRILVVEQTAELRQTIREYLESHRHQVTVAVNGRDGLATLLDHRPEIAFVDVGSSELDGFAVARAMRSAPGGDRVFLVALTGKGGAAARAEAFAAGFDLYLTKPVKPDALRAAISMAPPRGR